MLKFLLLLLLVGVNASSLPDTTTGKTITSISGETTTSISVVVTTPIIATNLSTNSTPGTRSGFINNIDVPSVHGNSSSLVPDTKSGLSDVIVLSSREVKCHACLDPSDISPECVCESAKCAFRTAAFSSTIVLERFCPTEKWVFDMLEDGCIMNADGEYVCYCSSNFCNDDDIAAIRGSLNCTTETCPNSTVCYDTRNAFKCTCPPWDPACEDRYTKQSSSSGCSPTNPNSPCALNCCATLNCNYGYCQNTAGICSCVCPVNFIGTNCQTAVPLNPCSTFVCQNGGTSYFTNGYCQCCCPAGYTGLQCQTQITCCTSYTCYNGGTCTASNNGQVCSCTCPSGFTGTQCATPTVNCCVGANAPNCSNGGVCQNNNGICSCCCPIGYSGSTCQIKNPCYPNPCNNGLCSVLPNSQYQCTCNSGWTGTNCNQVDCCASSPCRYGGTCYNDNGNCYCLCPDGYLGDYCQNYDCCTSNPCQNGGQCFYDPTANTCLCLCAQGFLGNYCEVCDCCWNKPCHNGGTCVNVNGVCSCSCTTGYSPPACDINYCYLYSTTGVNRKTATPEPLTTTTTAARRRYSKTTKRYFNHKGKVTTRVDDDNGEFEEELGDAAEGSYDGSPFTFRGRSNSSSVLYGDRYKLFN